MTSSVLKALRDRFTDSHITMVTKDIYSDVFRHNPCINQLLLLKKNNFKEIVRALKSPKTDLFVDLHNNPRSFVLSVAVFPKKILRYKKDVFGRRFMVLSAWIRGILFNRSHLDCDIISKTPSELRHIKHVADKYLSAVSSVCGKSQSVLPEIFVPMSKEKILSVFNIEHSSFIAGFNIGGKWKTKQWGFDKYIGLAGAVKDKYKATIIIFGDKNDFDAADAIAKETGAINLAGKTSLLELSELISFCNVFITGDSGAMHIASALQVPTVAVFGSTVAEFGFYPLGKKSVVLFSDVLCRPCALHGRKKCPIGTHVCMENISVKDVLDCIEKIVQLRQDKVLI